MPSDLVLPVKACNWLLRTVTLDQEHDPRDSKCVYMHPFYEAEIQSMAFIVSQSYHKKHQARGNMEWYFYLECVIMHLLPSSLNIKRDSY